MNITLAAVALGNDLVFAEELLGSLPKRLFVPDLAALVLAFELQKPVFCKILCVCETLFLGADAAVPAAQVG
jgi:hypothetical protein